MAGVRRHDPHRLDDRRGTGPQSSGDGAGEEGFTDGLSNHVVESFARHFMVAIDSWQESGFGGVASNYLARLPVEQGLRRDIDVNGDLLLRRMGKTGVEREALLPRLAEPAWRDPISKGPRT